MNGYDALIGMSEIDADLIYEAETVKKRLDVYHEQTQPLIDYYDKKNILKTVDGTKDMQEVFDNIVGILNA